MTTEMMLFRALIAVSLMVTWIAIFRLMNFVFKTQRSTQVQIEALEDVLHKNDAAVEKSANLQFDALIAQINELTWPEQKSPLPSRALKIKVPDDKTTKHAWYSQKQADVRNHGTWAEGNGAPRRFLHVNGYEVLASEISEWRGYTSNWDDVTYLGKVYSHGSVQA